MTSNEQSDFVHVYVAFCITIGEHARRPTRTAIALDPRRANAESIRAHGKKRSRLRMRKTKEKFS